MGAVAKRAVTKIAELLTARTGLNAALAEMTDAEPLLGPTLGLQQIIKQNVAAELAERSIESTYPLVAVYCDKIRNELKEKFRVFSGPARLVVEVRLTHDRLEGLEDVTEAYTDAVMQVLNQSRGDWGEGMYYAGGYEVDFGAVKRGGRGFLRTATVKFEVHISK
jgi:hypothetical protein